ATPIDFGRQHIFREVCHSDEFLDKPPTARHPDRRHVFWTQRAGVAPGDLRVRYEFYCSVDVHRPSSSMDQLAQTLYAPPHAGEHLQTEPLIETDHPDITALARRLTADRAGAVDQWDPLFRYVDQEVANEPSVGRQPLSAVRCLSGRSGDSAAKSRLLVALCRNRAIPARLVTGLALAHGPEQVAHVWVEAWVRNQWLPLCPFYHRRGRVPSNYLIFGFGDLPMVRGHRVQDLDCAFLVQHTQPQELAGAAETPRLKRIVRQLSLDALPPAEQRLVEFFLLLPIAALIVCLYRNVIGINSFGTFAPALVGLAFRDLHSLPGMLVFISIVLLSWGMRRLLDGYHLLQVPRTAF